MEGMGDNMAKFKDIFVTLRKEKGFNQEAMAKELGVSKSSIAMWETGDRLPSQELYEQIADYFNVDIDFLYGRTNVRKKIMYDVDGSEYVNAYYLNDDAREMAQFMFENPEYKVLFDASRKISKEDIETVKAIMDKFRSDDK